MAPCMMLLEDIVHEHVQPGAESMLTPVEGPRGGAETTASAFASLALLAAVALGAVLLLCLVLVTLITPFVFPLVLMAAAALARLEEARVARSYVVSSS